MPHITRNTVSRMAIAHHRPRWCIAVLLVLILPTLSALAQDTGDSTAHAGLSAYRPPVPGIQGLVTTANPLASAAGFRILDQGGTVADAALAIAATLTVVEPQSSGLGGNGYTILFDQKSGQLHALAMHGGAPLAVKPNRMTSQTLSYGIQASTTPGMIGGLIELLDRYGKLSLQQVLAPALSYARNGHPANASLVSSIKRQQAQIREYPTTAAVFLPNGMPPEVGQIFRQPQLASTLEKLIDAEQLALKTGAHRSQALRAAYDRFYHGDIAQEIETFFKQEGGLIEKRDLAAYQPQWVAPLHTTYRGYDIYANPSATRGGIEVLMQLNLIEGFNLKRLGYQSPEVIHLIAESIKVAKADAYHYLADPAFTHVPWDGLLSKSYANERRKLISLQHTITYPDAGQPVGATSMAKVVPHKGRLPEHYPPDPDTTSFSIVDAQGNALTCTPTVGTGFGAGVVVGNTGLLFNNGMRIGSVSPYADNVNALEPGKIPLLNNSPIMVMKEGKLVLAIGTPGGESIGQTQFQGIINVLDFGLNIQQAIEAPRIRVDATPSFYKAGATTTIALESRFPAATLDGLKARGQTLQILDAFTPGVGGMQGILVDSAYGTLTAGADPRRAGYAMGW